MEQLKNRNEEDLINSNFWKVTYLKEHNNFIPII
jgi:hypothetical protein